MQIKHFRSSNYDLFKTKNLGQWLIENDIAKREDDWEWDKI